jgi:hypothetical protein
MKAFPTVTGSTGMELRDYFAAKAMQGLLANPELGGCDPFEIADMAYEQAHVMLQARGIEE